MEDFATLLSQIAERPGMFVGSCSIVAVSHYLNGYAHALDDCGSWNGWCRWVELRFGISHPAWHWTRILLHVYGSDREALVVLPGLYGEFMGEREQQGLDSILVRWESRFSGCRVAAPDFTTTSPQM